MINGYSINSTVINGSASEATSYTESLSTIIGVADTYIAGLSQGEALAEIFNLLDIEPFGSYERAWADDVQVSGVMTDQFINAINEVYSLSASLSSSARRSMTVDDIFVLNDKLLVTLIAIVAENITLVHSYTDLFKLIGKLSEVVHLADANSSTANHKILVSSAFTLHALLQHAFHAEVMLESITITDEYVAIQEAAEALVDLITVNDLPVNSVRLTVISEEDLSLTDSTSNNASLFSTLEEGVVFLISFDDGSTTYQGFVMNPETYAVSTYDNYPFNSTTNYDGSYLLAGSAGLYYMEGDTDEGTYITSKVKTAALDFGSSSLKQCPKVYLGINNDASLILRVSVDGAYTSTYQLDIASDNLSTQIFDIGKGLKGRYWQFDLQTKNNSSFELDEIELFPITWGRKQR